MLQIQSKRLLGPLAVTTSSTPVLTVPAGHRYSVKSLKLYNSVSVGATTATFYVGALASANELTVLTFTSAGFMNLDPFRLTLEGLEDLRCVASASGALHLTLDGFDFIT